MISYQQLSRQLLQQAQQLEHAYTDAERREGLAAIRALCDLGLGAPGSKSETQAPTRFTEPSISQVAMPQPTTSPKAIPLQGERLEDDGANGDSLFDF